jgi:hypothetical protein
MRGGRASVATKSREVRTRAGVRDRSRAVFFLSRGHRNNAEPVGLVREARLIFAPQPKRASLPRLRALLVRGFFILFTPRSRPTGP